MPNPLVNKTDFNTYVQFSNNIESRKVDFHVQNAMVYEIEVRLGKLLFDALVLLPLQPTNPETQPQLRAFYNDYVKRFVCLVSYCRFVAEHGTNVTQFGFTQLNDPSGTFDTPSEDRRAVFLRQYRSDSDVALTRIFNRLKEVNYTFDSVLYDQNKTEQKKSLPISAVRRKNISDSPFVEPFNKHLNEWI